jgi:hypothetical protein
VDLSSLLSTSAALVAQHSTPKSRQPPSTVGQATPTRFLISHGLYVSLRRRIQPCPCSSWAILWCVQHISLHLHFLALVLNRSTGRCIGTLVRDASQYAGKRFAAVGNYCVKSLSSPHQTPTEYHTPAGRHRTHHPSEPEHTSVSGKQGRLLPPLTRFIAYSLRPYAHYLVLVSRPGCSQGKRNRQAHPPQRVPSCCR